MFFTNTATDEQGGKTSARAKNAFDSLSKPANVSPLTYNGLIFHGEFSLIALKTSLLSYKTNK